MGTLIPASLLEDLAFESGPMLWGRFVQRQMPGWIHPKPLGPFHSTEALRASAGLPGLYGFGLVLPRFRKLVLVWREKPFGFRMFSGLCEDFLGFPETTWVFVESRNQASHKVPILFSRGHRRSGALRRFGPRDPQSGWRPI